MSSIIKAFCWAFLGFLSASHTGWGAKNSEGQFFEALENGEGQIQAAAQDSLQKASLNPISLPDTKDTARCIRDPRCRRLFVVAHRGFGLGAPESSRGAAQGAVRMGLKVMEIDLRASQDGQVYVICHSEMKNTTSIKKGKIGNYSSATLENAHLKNGESLPKFQDIYAITRGRVVLDLHFKEDLIEKVADWIHENGSFDDVIFFVQFPAPENAKSPKKDRQIDMRNLARLKKKYPEMMVLLRIHDVGDLIRAKAVWGFKPEIVHTDYPSSDLLDVLHALEVKVFANVLFEEHFGFLGHGQILKLLRTDVDFVQTDHPLTRREESRRFSPYAD
ncbi:MAG: glycerophosphodiester phosphodiesterase family protein [Elusimicrobia bacterium]|nr:glycerophosphodiester phosphodiesterase family protein [Elusimicrobiota bacterium]